MCTAPVAQHCKRVLFPYLDGGDDGKLMGGPPGSTPPPYAGGKLPPGVMLSELPEPPIPVSEIGPIPPPPMFSTPSPTLIAGRPHGPGAMNDQDYQQDYDYDGKQQQQQDDDEQDQAAFLIIPNPPRNPA